MEDENAERVYVPGTPTPPPDRDVEPLWTPEEPPTPIHGGKPVPHPAPPPAVPTAPPPAVPVPPPRAIPVPRQFTPTQAWPNLEPPALNGSAPAGSPALGSPAEPDPAAPSAPDSPWSQPPHRPLPAAVPRTPEPTASPPPFPPEPYPQTAPPANPLPPASAPPTAPPGPFPPTPPPSRMQQASAPAPQQPAPPADPFQDLPWVSDGTPTAEEFARRRMAKPAEPVATMGARALLTKGTMGLVRLAPGKREIEYKQDIEMVRRNFGGLRQVTVVNPKGGAGKTVAVLLLAMTFGQKRGGYVLAWDNNETQGTLGMRAQQDFHARTVRDMMRDLHLFRGAHGRVGDLSQYVRAQGEGMFDVLASDESATAGEMLTADAFGEIRESVSRFYKLIFVDTGNNVRAQNWQAAMDATDQLVITMSARNDSAETAARMLDHLEQTGRQRLVRQAVSVVSMPPTRKDIDLPAIQRHFAARTRAVLLAPYEKLIDSGEPLRYGQLSNNTKDAWLKIAAAVAEGL